MLGEIFSGAACRSSLHWRCWGWRCGRGTACCRCWWAGASGFVAYLCLLELIGYPVSARFFEPPAGMLCVLAGVGCCRRRAGPAARAPAARPSWRAAGRGAGAGGLRGAAASRTRFAAAHDRAVLQNDLRDAVHAFGPERLTRCGDPILRGDLHWNEGAMAFDLDEHLKDVRRVLPWKAIDGQLPSPR